jgi:prepilin-type N-terminal cleavage/methylation domain-containing protein
MQAPRRASRNRSGFTLVEVLIASALASILMAAVMSTFLMLGRSGMALANYSEMDGEARRALETFARDVRQADAITWNSATSITVNVGAESITYALSYDDRQADWQFRRGAKSLIQGIDPASFKMTGFQVAFTTVGHDEDAGELIEPRPVVIDLTDLAQASRETKQLQLELRSSRARPWLARTSNSVVSARYILRNKRVTS